MRKKITAQLKQDIIADIAAAQLSLRGIARKYDVSEKTVRNIKKKQGQSKSAPEKITTKSAPDVRTEVRSPQKPIIFDSENPLPEITIGGHHYTLTSLIPKIPQCSFESEDEESFSTEIGDDGIERRI